MTSNARLWIIGTPLAEGVFLSEEILETLLRCDVIIGESAKVARRWTSKRRALETKTWFYLDGMKSAEQKALVQELGRSAKAGTDVALFSDGGMPILFDPGAEVLEQCKRLGFRIRTIAGPTSWATACAVSGWEPPFLVQGFPPRKTEEREAFLDHLSKRHEAIVLLDTPYRFELLIEQATKAFDRTRPVFIAWEIGTDAERYVWCTVEKLRSTCERERLNKGEFVLIIGPH